MQALLLKEIKSFLSSLIGYIAIIVFLIITGLMLWVFPYEYNLFSLVDASVRPFFELAPWVFLLLIPAITMRSFAEEKRTGTIELLYTKPLTDLEIVLAKFFAGFLLVLISLVPTLVYYFTMNNLGDPPGNVDSGETWGAYIGLFFLGGAYVSIGVFSSAITNNQVVAFILSTFLCFFIYRGFHSIGFIEFVDDMGWSNAIQSFGIYAHFESISRGVVDTRDLIYFISLIVIFVLATKVTLQSRNW